MSPNQDKLKYPDASTFRDGTNNVPKAFNLGLRFCPVYLDIYKKGLQHYSNSRSLHCLQRGSNWFANLNVSRGLLRNSDFTTDLRFGEISLPYILISAPKLGFGRNLRKEEFGEVRTIHVDNGLGPAMADVSK